MLSKYSLLFILAFTLLLNQVIAQISANNHPLYISTYYNAEQYTKCIQYIDSIAFEKQDANYLKYKADCYYSLGDYDKAKIIYLKVYSTNSKIGQLELARCYALNNQVDSAIYFLNLHLNSRNKAIINHVKSDKAFKTINESEAWLNLWQQDWYSKSELMLADADYEYRQKHYDEALRILEEITKKRKSMHQAYQMQAVVHHANADYASALYAINQAIKLKPKRTDYLYQKACYELDLNKSNKALKSIDIVLEKDSSNIEYYITRAKANYKQKQYEYALLDIESVNEIIERESVLYLMGQINYDDGGYIQALKSLNQCIKKYGAKQEYLMLRANTYLKSGVYKYAENDFSSLLDYTPTNGEIYYWRGICRQKQGFWQPACQDWHKARKYHYIKVDELLEKYCR